MGVKNFCSWFIILWFIIQSFTIKNKLNIIIIIKINSKTWFDNNNFYKKDNKIKIVDYPSLVSKQSYKTILE